MKKNEEKNTTQLVVMIPAYNEEATLESVIQSIPPKMDGIAAIHVLVIDDGSTDLTTSIARKNGARVISNHGNKGLAYTFSRGLEESLKMGADIIVNTDGDDQYDQREIPALIQPILSGKADIVLGSRFAGYIEEMPFSKKMGNRLASWILSRVSGYRNLTDGQTGFRAFTRDAAMRLNILSGFTYTQEMIIDAADKGLVLSEIPCTFRKRAGKSRLFNGILDYFKRAVSTIIIGNLKLHPISTFSAAGIILTVGGIAIGLPVIDNFIRTGAIGPAFLMRALVTSLLFIIGIEIAALGLIAALIKQNRQLVEKQLYESRKARFSKMEI